ncbi:MAG: dihydrofolate reductase, partial [Burkholderiales bacterium]
VLPGRENIVITRDPNWQHAPVKVYPSLIEAIKDNQDSAELCIIGGGEVFTQALPMADKLLLTLVEVEVPNATPNTTAFFPQVNWQQWQLVKQTQITTKDNICCCFKEFIRQEV